MSERHTVPTFYKVQEQQEFKKFLGDLVKEWEKLMKEPLKIERGLQEEKIGATERLHPSRFRRFKTEGEGKKLPVVLQLVVRKNEKGEEEVEAIAVNFCLAFPNVKISFIFKRLSKEEREIVGSELDPHPSIQIHLTGEKGTDLTLISPPVNPYELPRVILHILKETLKLGFWERVRLFLAKFGLIKKPEVLRLRNELSSFLPDKPSYDYDLVTS